MIRKVLRMLVIVAILMFATNLVSASDKVTICHKPDTPAEGTLEVAAASVQAHIDHGDYLGECNGVILPPDICTVLNDPSYDTSYISASAEVSIETYASIDIYAFPLDAEYARIFFKILPDETHYAEGMSPHIYTHVSPREGPVTITWGVEIGAPVVWHINCYN